MSQQEQLRVEFENKREERKDEDVNMSHTREESRQAPETSRTQEGTREETTAHPSVPNVHDEAADAARQAFIAQQEAQEAIKRAYAKQVVAQERAQQATQQLTAQNETANEVAVMAARQAAEQAAKGQKRVSEEQFQHQAVAHEAGKVALSAAQQQPGVVDSGLGSVFPEGCSTQHAFGQEPLSIQQAAQGFVLQAANNAAAEAQAQMTEAQQLGAAAQDPASQQQASQQAITAQQRMEVAQKMAESAQAPDSALQAAAYLSGNRS